MENYYFLFVIILLIFLIFLRRNGYVRDGGGNTNLSGVWNQEGGCLVGGGLLSGMDDMKWHMGRSNLGSVELIQKGKDLVLRMRGKEYTGNYTDSGNIFINMGDGCCRGKVQRVNGRLGISWDHKSESRMGGLFWSRNSMNGLWSEGRELYQSIDDGNKIKLFVLESDGKKDKRLHGGVEYVGLWEKYPSKLSLNLPFNYVYPFYWNYHGKGRLYNAYSRRLLKLQGELSDSGKMVKWESNKYIYPHSRYRGGGHTGSEFIGGLEDIENYDMNMDMDNFQGEIELFAPQSPYIASRRTVKYYDVRSGRYIKRSLNPVFLRYHSGNRYKYGYFPVVQLGHTWGHPRSVRYYDEMLRRYKFKIVQPTEMRYYDFARKRYGYRVGYPKQLKYYSGGRYIYQWINPIQMRYSYGNPIVINFNYDRKRRRWDQKLVNPREVGYIYRGVQRYTKIYPRTMKHGSGYISWINCINSKSLFFFLCYCPN